MSVHCRIIQHSTYLMIISMPMWLHWKASWAATSMRHSVMTGTVVITVSCNMSLHGGLNSKWRWQHYTFLPLPTQLVPYGQHRSDKHFNWKHALTDSDRPLSLWRRLICSTHGTHMTTKTTLCMTLWESIFLGSVHMQHDMLVFLFLQWIFFCSWLWSISDASSLLSFSWF